jgi:excisionase family DNA binding protein
MNRREAAVLLGVTEQHVSRLARRRAIKGRFLGGQWYLDEASVVAYRDAGHRPGRPAAAEGESALER